MALFETVRLLGKRSTKVCGPAENRILHRGDSHWRAFSFVEWPASQSVGLTERKQGGSGVVRSASEHRAARQSDTPKNTLSRLIYQKLKREGVKSEEWEEKHGRNSFSKVIEHNKRWVASKVAEDPEYFSRQHDRIPHKPSYLWIGCSDCGMSAHEVSGLNPNEVFVHRNVGNLVVNSDINLLSVLQHATDRLRVRHIVVCGHYCCDGVEAAMENKDHGLIDHWLRHVRDVSRLHQPELVSITDKTARHRRLVELNVMEQCLNLLKNGIVQSHVQRYGYPHVHAAVYDKSTGLIKELDTDFSRQLKRYQDIYRLYDFKHPHSLYPTRKKLQQKLLRRLYDRYCDEGEEKDGRLKGKLHVQVLTKAMRKEADLFTKEEVARILDSVEVNANGEVAVEDIINLLHS